MGEDVFDGKVYIQDQPISVKVKIPTTKGAFLANLAATLYSYTDFDKVGTTANVMKTAKACITKAKMFWDALPSEWQAEFTTENTTTTTTTNKVTSLKDLSAVVSKK